MAGKFLKKTSNFINKIGKPEDSTSKKLLAFFVFLLSKEGRRLTKAKVRRKLVYLNILDHNKYHKWMSKKLDIGVLTKEYEEASAFLTNRPLVSIIMPVYNPPVNFLLQAIKSVEAQLYPNWELCIADDNSTDKNVTSLLQELSKNDSRVRVVFRKENGHISLATNSALEIAKGTYLLFMDHDDLLTVNCLSEVVKHINAHPQNGIIYSDEDKINDKGVFREPHFKSDWAPDSLLSSNYIGHVVVMKKDLVDEIGGFRKGLEGSQDYDLLLRATEKTNNIGHIPKVLYHWRIHQDSVASDNSDAKPYAYVAAQKAISDALARRNTPGTVSEIPDFGGGYKIDYEVKRFDKVSIIIPTKDHTALLKNTIDSIISLTNYPAYEIIVLNNNSTTKEFFELMNGYKAAHPDVFRCIEANIPFNFASLMNLGAKESNGKYLLFLNNDVKVLQNDWITKMVSFAQHEHTGAVGVKLLYPDNTIQHAGVVVGMGGAAAHVHAKCYKTERGYFNNLHLLTNYSAVTAACVLFRRSVFDEVGGMNEELIIEYNDVDLCLRFLEHGYFNIYLPDVELYHYESSTRGHAYQSKESWEKHLHDFNVFEKRWKPIIERDPNFNPNLSLLINDFSINYLS